MDRRRKRCSTVARARCCCATPAHRSTTRSVQARDDLPRLMRAGRHIARPKRYIRDLGVEIEPDQLVAEVAVQAERGDGWVKLAADWIDRSVGDLAPVWPDDVLAAAVAKAHELGVRVAAHVFGEDALPGLIAAGIDSIEHGMGLTDDLVDRPRARGCAVVPTLINIDNMPGIAAGRGGEVPGVRGAHAGVVRDVARADSLRLRGGRADLHRHRRRRQRCRTG